MKILKFFGFDRRNRSPIQENKANPPSKKEEVPISPGRVSEPDDDPGNFIHTLKGLTQMVTPSFRVEVIQLFTLRGSFDIDDLFLNLIGVAVGFLLRKVVLHENKNTR